MKTLTRALATAATAAVSVCMAAGIAPIANADTTNPPDLPGLAKMGPPPPGANDWSCKPTAEHPEPIVLVHGTGSNMQLAFPVMAPALKKAGYCVFALNYGGIPTWYNPNIIVWGVSDIRQSAHELSNFVDAVLAKTGARQVDLVGHSQGGVVSRQYLKFDGGADPADPAKNKVKSLVALGPTNHGTTFNGQQQLYSVLAQTGLSPDVIDWAIFGIAGRQQLVGSRLISDLNATGETVPGVDYTVIAAKDDQVVTPPQGSFLQSNAPNVHNLWVQDGCPGIVRHSGLLLQPRPIYMTLVALDPSYAKNNPAPCP
ncbi:esterase/lipase family protein [Antrihabitans cavernicola]|uniref:Alpha/beta fold hydrolase n=1 Tax=Antrihabitans cavernicola TaxID=2495913 RepID=A0A5A7SBH9_9NOCA|nr:alpha/beta fold hydrolase [Spelaeibacter cavernicola]KAA0021581.1 alpha/beta fold hydrolase [Spelaeibacter cavernicola]